MLKEDGEDLVNKFHIRKVLFQEKILKGCIIN